MPKTQKTPTMQEQLLFKALAEQNIKDCRIKISHKVGISFVDNLPLGIKYPKYFLKKCNELDQKKKYKYVFKGGFSTSQSSVTIDRKTLLNPFMQRDDSCILETRQGIKRSSKTDVDVEYFQLIANSEYSLCPNWAGRWWDHNYAWTYRFIESCFAKSIPILFKQAPIGQPFYRDIFFFWSDEDHKLSESEYQDIVESNYEKAVKHYTLQKEEIRILKKL